MFAHVVAYFGGADFDQTRMLWFAFLSIIVASTVAVAVPHPLHVPNTHLPMRSGRAATGKYAGPTGKLSEPVYRHAQLRQWKT